MKSIGGKYKQKIEDFIVEEVCKPREKKEQGPYQILKISKKNWEHHRLMNVIAKKAKVKPNCVTFHGIKDKNGICIQEIAIRSNMDITKDISEINDITILEHYRWGHPLGIGGHIANKFTIVIKDTILKGEELKENLLKKALELKKGIYNKFGEQRFGVNNTTLKLGNLVFNKKYLDALLMIINFQKDVSISDNPSIEEMKDVLNTIENKNNLEAKILVKLMEGVKPRKILYELPGNLMKLYLRSKQAYEFNESIELNAKFFCPYDNNGNILTPLVVEMPPSELSLYLSKQELGKGTLCHKLGDTFRPQRLFVENLEIFDIDNSSYKLSFCLKKGAYATEVLKYFIE